MIPIIVAIPLTLLFYILYYVSKRKYDYWEKQNVPFLNPAPFFGNFKDFILMKKYFGEVTQEICQSFPNEPYIGAYYGSHPALIIQDPELMKLVTTKDFYYFSSREVADHTHKEVLTQNLFFTQGDRWKVLRQNLTPLFSSAKMKNMFHLVEKSCRLFEEMLDVETSKSTELEARDLMVRYTMETVCSCAFGVNTYTMKNQSTKNTFKVMGDLIFDNSNTRGFKVVARSVWPSIFYGLGFHTFPLEVNEFFDSLIKGVFKGRDYKPSSRNDFVDLILDFKKNNFISGDSLSNMKTGSQERVSMKVDDDLLVSQCVMMFAAGFETSASTLSFLLYELAKNPDKHKLAQEEVDQYLLRHNNKLGYECVTELPYLDACLSEALRLYPVLGVVNREVVEDYTLPSGVRLEKGFRIQLPVYHLHRNPDYFADPEEFRPERFVGENKKDIKPYTYMPFGEGPRICIGMRFAKMQGLAGLVTLLKKYRLELAEGMSRKLELEPRAIVTQPVGGIHLKIIPRDGWEKRVFA